MKVLQLLLNSLTVAEYFNTNYQKDFTQDFAIGAQVTVKFPQKFLVRDGLTYSPQGLNRISTTVSLDEPFGIDFEFDDYERAVKMERSKAELQEQYWEPLAAQLAQEIDSRAALFAKNNASNVVGVLGTDPTAVNSYYAARRRLKEKAAPKGKRAMLLSTSMMASLGQNITTLFQPGDELSQMFKEGYLGRLAGFDMIESNSIFTHTAGTWAGAVQVTGAGQFGSSLIITGTNGDTIKAGDKFSIANVNAVNPMTRRVAGPAAAQNFVCPIDFTLTGAADTIPILPAIFGPGSQYQNVDALPINNAALTLWPGTGSPNGKVGTVGLALTGQAFALVGAKLYTPSSTESAGQQRDPNSGLSIRMVKAWDPRLSLNINRADTVLGFGNLFQDNGAVCVAGA
jgi:hypothetical protein